MPNDYSALMADAGAIAEALQTLCDEHAEEVGRLYTVGDIIGEGRFSKVYAGTHAATGEPVALKELDKEALQEDEEALEMLEAEVLALRRASGATHVVKLHQVVACSDAIWLAMERVRGRELFEVVEERGALVSA